MKNSVYYNDLNNHNKIICFVKTKHILKSTFQNTPAKKNK